MTWSASGRGLVKAMPIILRAQFLKFGHVRESRFLPRQVNRLVQKENSALLSKNVGQMASLSGVKVKPSCLVPKLAICGAIGHGTSSINLHGKVLFLLARHGCD
ncbi:hypothetical protein BT93_L2690 [Corymbia citriodora subsp. variegata]|uniref:Uncharacterized protein n=1 Tax=Corymbia citriodora subsp. variegata TaxID=360336 RepID=A0A8T0CJ57_CORYI|nr:hypothetical protein BT93_L2690 [Corymbia citriodora subsp. variegata]